MPRDARVDLDWADSTYSFRLGWGEIEKLQEACDAGPFVVLDRLQNGQSRIGDISHTIRLGLVGGGMEPAAALKKVREYVEKRPPAENLIYARAILAAGCYGAPEEELGNVVAADPEIVSTTSPTAS
jgi:hypothetical protein